mmetsp:Transcript_16668/g.37485  ORF Transcript_16668/g.37485 Transcript_16668/m.37485 type:complete len:162 (-) Transcript_16668:374-859(-)
MTGINRQKSPFCTTSSMFKFSKKKAYGDCPGSEAYYKAKRSHSSLNAFRPKSKKKEEDDLNLAIALSLSEHETQLQNKNKNEAETRPISPSTLSSLSSQTSWEAAATPTADFAQPRTAATKTDPSTPSVLNQQSISHGSPRHKFVGSREMKKPPIEYHEFV